MTERFPMTKAGERKIRDELEFLKKEKRPQVINAIAEARAHGDLKENAEYHAAKEEQGLIEAKIGSLEHQLKQADVIDVLQFKNSGKVVFGATVTMINLETEKQIKYQIVGDFEADISNGLLSVRSPMAKGCIGRVKGDIVEIELPAGIQEFEIIDVDYL